MNKNELAICQKFRIPVKVKESRAGWIGNGPFFVNSITQNYSKFDKKYISSPSVSEDVPKIVITIEGFQNYHETKTELDEKLNSLLEQLTGVTYTAVLEHNMRQLFTVDIYDLSIEDSKTKNLRD